MTPLIIIHKDKEKQIEATWSTSKPYIKVDKECNLFELSNINELINEDKLDPERLMDFNLEIDEIVMSTGSMGEKQVIKLPHPLVISPHFKYTLQKVDVSNEPSDELYKAVRSQHFNISFIVNYCPVSGIIKIVPTDTKYTKEAPKNADLVLAVNITANLPTEDSVVKRLEEVEEVKELSKLLFDPIPVNANGIFDVNKHARITFNKQGYPNIRPKEVYGLTFIVAGEEKYVELKDPIWFLRTARTNYQAKTIAKTIEFGLTIDGYNVPVHVVCYINLTFNSDSGIMTLDGGRPLAIDYYRMIRDANGIWLMNRLQNLNERVDAILFDTKLWSLHVSYETMGRNLPKQKENE